MEYDKRIIDPSDNIWSAFGATSEQEISGGLEGYFADSLTTFANLGDCREGTLICIDWNSCFPFEARVNKGKDTSQFAFFLPARHTKTKEKKYRPFASTEEFFEKTGFETGDVIHVRDTDSDVEYHLMLVGYAECTLMLGVSRLNLKELFKWFELWDGDNKFVPFGVEES